MPRLPRAHTYKFDEFLSQWVDKIRSTSESSAVVVRLQQEVDRMEAALPLLKYVGGEILSLDHWQELFRMLELPRDTTMEQLTFGEVLGASDLIVQRAQDLKVSVASNHSTVSTMHVHVYSLTRQRMGVNYL